MENHLQILFVLFLIPCALPNLSGASSSDAVFGVWKRLINNLPPAQQQEAAARGVLQRLLPRHVDSFHFQIVPTELCDGKACFFISNYSGRNLDGLPEIEISIKGTTGVELCAGLHWYLKNLCGAHISWDITGGPQLATVPEPGSLPRLLDRVQVQRPVPWNYYQNVVTSSYSFVWWNWKRWEKELDWMALQGINLPLAFTGQEAIWQKVYQSDNFNLTKDDLDDYFGGPAFLAWARMGNLHRWGGPLPQTWLDGQLVLQKQIFYSMRNLGMVAVLPAFSGNVPHALMKIYPSANITRLSNWNTVHSDPRWCCTYLLQPTDPLFIKIGKSFVERQILEYGFTNHIYNCDTFNENKPPTDDTLYISSLARAVYAGMTAGDGSAIWLMQGWLFASDSQYWRPPQMKALLHAVPFGRMIVLDLFADVKPIWSRSEHFYGVPYIWCMLHNFGGNMEMYGRLDVISSGPIAARRSLNSTMVGVGMCMEGIEQNPVVYELMAEMAFQSDDVQLERWLESYVTRRYGQTAPEVQAAWKILHHTVYNCSDGTADHNTDVIVKFPDINASLAPDEIRESRHLLSGGFQLPGHNWYSPVSVKMALAYLLNASVPTCKAPTFRYDLVDLTRQMLSKLANQLYMSALLSFENKDMVNLKKYSILLLDLLVDLETVLQADNGFLLGQWLENAKQMATSQNEMELYEWNARTQITMWFDNTYDEPSSLHDYANKMWSGLVKDYYLPRAALYLELLQSSMVNSTVFPFHLWRVKWISLTNRWQNAKDNYPTISEGDPVQISKSVFDKYAYLVEDVELDLAR